MTLMYAMLRKSLPVFILFVSASAMLGQVATGTYPYGTFDNQGIDTINVGNLNVHFAIPVLNKAGRGSPFTYVMSYDSSVWTPVKVSGVTTWQPVLNWGWRGVSEIATGYISEVSGTTVCSWTTGIGKVPNGWQTLTFDVAYHDQWGVPHPFFGDTYTQSPDCGSPTSGGTIGPLATDGSGYQYASGQIISPSGKVLSVPVNKTGGASTATDSNGNEISVDSSGHFKDTTGNIAITVAGGAPNPETFTYTDTNGNSQTVSMTYATYTVQTTFGCSGIGEYGPTSQSLVNSISFPDGSTYTLSYEATPGASGKVTGRLAGVELPQGGSITYTYSGGSNGIECADGSTAGLTRALAANSGSAASTWAYTRTITGSGTSQTAVVDGLGNHKSYSFVEASNQPAGTTAVYYETSRSVYQGVATGTPVVARNTCYNGAASPCTTTAPSVPISQIDTYATLDGIQTNGATAKYNGYGAQTEADVYDFGGSTSRGLLLRKEVWTYGYSIPSLVTQDEVFDGSGNLAGETLYAYDGGTLTGSSGVPQHIAESGPRGNLTSEMLYANSSTNYSTSATYEDTGSLLTSTTPTGTTTASYDPTFVYTTGLQVPTPSSGVSLQSTATYDTAYTGLALSVTDPNTQTTRISSYDSMLRPTEVDSPDGGKTIMSYSPT
jgi:hypothetical protein